jgi:hypothetical protein
MSSPDSKPPSLIPPAVTAARSPDTFRTKSIATRLTEAEFAEVEEAAARDGKKVGEWLRDAALAEARGEDERDTDPILLAELMGRSSGLGAPGGTRSVTPSLRSTRPINCPSVPHWTSSPLARVTKTSTCQGSCA